MARPTPHTVLRAFLYGGASTLLLFDILFLVRAVWEDNYFPVVPLLTGVLVAGGLLFLIAAEQRARDEDKREHRQLSRVANQLESPLQALEEDLQFLMGRAESLPAEERLKLKHMQTKTQVLIENIRDVFLTLQAEQGKVVQEFHTYDAGQVVKEAVERLKPLASARNVEMVFKKPSQEALVKLDRRLFLIALTHILENAILYTLKPGLVNVAMVQTSKNVRIVVQDRGVGIEPSDSTAVFRPFLRGKNADQFDPDGIGVGLTLSRMLIEQLKGKLVWRPRQHSTGTEFEVVLPLHVPKGG
jgi:K+-sensing histidine kinase KdpD